MKPSDIILTPKFRDLLKSKARVIHCEGVTGSSKSFQLGIKYFFEVFNAPKEKTQFVMTASTVSVAERMMIDNPTSFFNIFNTFCKHNRNGVGGNKIIVTTPTGNKIIYLGGYDDANRFKEILGLGISGFLVEEIHVAGEAFIREMFTRVYRDGGFLYTSSNGGLPDLMVYKNYLNKARPNSKYEHEVPESTMNELLSTPHDPMFEFWFYRFEDNPKMSEEQIRLLYTAHPVGSFEYNSKILGIRGFVEGAIYAKYMTYDKNLVDYDEIMNRPPFIKYTIGIDVGSTDFTVVTLVGFTTNYKEAIVLDYMEINHAGVDEIWNAIDKWLRPYERLVHRIYGAFIDSAAQIVKSSLAPRFLTYYGIQMADSYKYTIKERVDWGIRFLHSGRLKFTTRCKNIYSSFTKALYTTKSNATDIREYINHIDKDRIDGTEYAITPFIQEMLNYIQ